MSHVIFKDGRRKEIRTFSTKEMANHSTDHSSYRLGMQFILERMEEEEFGLDVRLGDGSLYMETDVFWKYLWLFAEREISVSELVAESCLGWARSASEYDRLGSKL